METKTIRCKLRCDSVTETPTGYITRFYAVHSGSPENEEFFKYTPSASFELGTSKEKHFEVGKEYYVDIKLANLVAVPA